MTQPIGLAPWNPTGDSKRIVGQVQEILEEYRQHLPLTGRQIFYRMVGAHGYDKTEKAYKRLLDKLNRARRAGLIPFDSLRDDGVTVHRETGWESPDRVIEVLRRQADYYTRDDRLQNQDRTLEIWVEAAGMVPQAGRLADPYTIPVYSCGGFNSTTMKYDAARRFARNARQGRETVILHVGDHDPSGVSIFDNLREDVTTLAADLGLGAGAFASIEWERVAVTEDQAIEFDLDSAPPKATDSRSRNWIGETYQAEALDPGTLADVIQQAIDRHVDADLYRDLLDLEAEEREDLRERLLIAFPEDDA